MPDDLDDDGTEQPRGEPEFWAWDDTIVLGDDVAKRLTARPERPTQAALDAVCGSATRVVVVDVREVEMLGADEFRTSPELLADVTDPAVLERLRRALRIHELDQSWRAGTGCDLVLEVFRDGEHTGSIAVYRDAEISWNRLEDIARLIDPEPLLAWLDERGASFVREALEEDRAEAERQRAETDRWFAAMPACLERHREAMLANRMPFDWTDAKGDLSRAYPDPVDAVRSLFEWFGSGRGPWSGVPGYETAPEWYLLSVPLDVLVRAAASEPVNERLTEGAARFFGGWWFNTQRGDDRELLPHDLKQRLLAHTLRSDDDDKQHRARQAFG